MKNKITIDEKASSIVNITNIIKYSNKLINNCIKFLLSPPSILLQSLQGTSPISPLGNCQVRLSSFPGTQSITETQSRNNRDWHKITGNNTSKNPGSRSRGCESRFLSRRETERENVWNLFPRGGKRFAYRVRTARSRNSWAVGVHFCTLYPRGGGGEEGWRRSPSLRHPPAVRSEADRLIPSLAKKPQL